MENKETNLRTHLYKSSEGSNKEYLLTLIATGDGLWKVQVEWEQGRRNQGNNATKGSVPYEVAKKKYDDLLYEKLTDAYVENISGRYASEAEKVAEISRLRLMRKFKKVIKETPESIPMAL